MSWACTEDWKIPPQKYPATENMMAAIVFGDCAKFRPIRNRWFCRCNASGKWIWPFQTAYIGVVKVIHGDRESFGKWSKGSYSMAWLNEEQYLMQKLKGNI